MEFSREKKVLWNSHVSCASKFSSVSSTASNYRNWIPDTNGLVSDCRPDCYHGYHVKMYDERKFDLDLVADNYYKKFSVKSYASLKISYSQ